MFNKGGRGIHRRDRLDEGFDDGEGISERRWGRDECSQHSGSDLRDRRSRNEVWVVRAGHDIVFDDGDDRIKRKRVREKRWWGVTFHSHSKWNLHF